MYQSINIQQVDYLQGTTSNETEAIRNLYQKYKQTQNKDEDLIYKHHHTNTSPTEFRAAGHTDLERNLL